MARRKSIIQRRQFVTQALTLGTATATVVSLGGCGTLLHRERLNQPRSRDLDWKIVALNGLGLIFFFVPGVIAFVVDFHTGAIYLPPYGGAMKPPLADDPEQIADYTQRGSEMAAGSTAATGAAAEPAPLRKVAVVTGDLNVVAIEREVTHQVGRPVWVSETSSRVTRLEKLDEFAGMQQRCHADQTFGLPPQTFLQRWLPRVGVQRNTG